MHRPVTNPRYQMLANELRQSIERGEYKPGDRLPSESELCASYGVSRGTVVRAIEQLVSEGAVHRRQGSGSFVTRPSLHRRAGKLLSFTESAAGDGLRSTQSLLSIGQATSEQVAQFQCGGPAIDLRRLRFIDGLPCAVHHSVIPTRVARNVDALNGSDPDQLQRVDFSLYGALDSAGYTVREAQERVTTRLAQNEECSLLNIDPPAAVMVVFRRSFDGSGKLVEAVEAVHHGEYYTYDMRLVAAPSMASGRAEEKVLSLGGHMIHPNDNNRE